MIISESLLDSKFVLGLVQYALIFRVPKMIRSKKKMSLKTVKKNLTIGQFC